VEDGYQAWLAAKDATAIRESNCMFEAQAMTREEIAAIVPAVIAFAMAAMGRKNQYRWGGTVGPDYDCSGLSEFLYSSFDLLLLSPFLCHSTLYLVQLPT
jgi:cell wall-associated NlpC family hydrolase